MAIVRTHVFFFVLLVSYRLALSEPTFGSSLFCSLFCDDSDDSGDEDDDYDVYDFFGICSACTTNKTPAETTTTAKPESAQPVKIMIPPANGLNLTLLSNVGGFLMNLVPWAASPTTAATAAPTTAAPVTTAGNDTATTAAPTTKKK